MKIRDFMDIFASIVLLIIVVGFIKSRIVILDISVLEFTELIASVWAFTRLGNIAIYKIKNRLLQKRIKNSMSVKNYYKYH